MILDDIISRDKELNRKITENNLIDRQIEEKSDYALKTSKELVIGQEALQFLEDVANSRRGAMKEKIENVISNALKIIYGNKYSVEFDYSIKNNRSCLDIELLKDTVNGVIKRQMNGFGGGVSDTISVPLRLLVLLGSKQTDRVCILDESYKHIDLSRIELVAEFIKDISEKLGIQIIMCSHHEAMREYADVVYEVSDVSGESVVASMRY